MSSIEGKKQAKVDVHRRILLKDISKQWKQGKKEFKKVFMAYLDEKHKQGITEFNPKEIAKDLGVDLTFVLIAIEELDRENLIEKKVKNNHSNSSL